jgi:serine protease inhibitor
MTRAKGRDRVGSLRPRKVGLKLFVASSLWPQQDYRFLDTYLSLAKEHYGVSITPVDYQHATEAARQQINL